MNQELLGVKLYFNLIGFNLLLLKNSIFIAFEMKLIPYSNTHSDCNTESIFKRKTDLHPRSRIGNPFY